MKNIKHSSGCPFIESQRCSTYGYPITFRGILHLLASGGLHLTVLLEADSRNVDESSGLSGREVTDLVHAGLGHIVQLLSLRRAAKNGDTALVGTAADLAVDGLLGSSNGGLQELALGGEVHAVVQELY